MKKMSETIVFFGNEKLATGIPVAKPVIQDAIRAAGFKVEQVITGDLNELGKHEAKMAVLAAYGKIIPQAILDQFPLGVINVHPSLLPAYRGPTPIEQAILDGAVKTGVSIMRLTAGMDEGPVYKQKTLNLTGLETKVELAEKLQRIGSKLLVELLPGIADGSIKPRQQPHPSRATYSHKISKEAGNIDWNKPAQVLEREIRAYAQWPNSRATLGGRDIVITKARVIPGSGIPGTVTIMGKDVVVFCKEDALLIERLKPAGKSEMTSEAFIAGHKHLF